ncbi:hypothetical protein HY496_01110 [Candidatus Woesearchaeota archaeon]|nr:hypothetical protein [Candidatus Woesearchaeota archaeon]
MMGERLVHIIGTGTIGGPLIGLFARHRKEWDIDHVSFHKRTPLKEDRPTVKSLMDQGAVLAVDESVRQEFERLGMKPTYDATEALERADVVIDCTPVGNQNKGTLYEKMNGPKGFIAQGSEFGFGKPYARGINDRALIPGEDRYIQVVSCNTHALAALTKVIGYTGTTQEPIDTENLVKGKFLFIRRATDISQDEDFAASPSVDKHKDSKYGTHHARDGAHLYSTLGVEPAIFSSSMKIPSQYMHVTHFTITVRDQVETSDLVQRIKDDEYLAVTHKKTTGNAFSFGRDQGYHGRIFNQAIIPTSALHVSPTPAGWDVTGFSFTPQDGNSLLSSMSAALWMLDPQRYEQQLESLKRYIFKEI